MWLEHQPVQDYDFCNITSDHQTITYNYPITRPLTKPFVQLASFGYFMMIHRRLLPFCAVRKPSCKITWRFWQKVGDTNRLASIPEKSSVRKRAKPTSCRSRISFCRYAMRLRWPVVAKPASSFTAGKTCDRGMMSCVRKMPW